MRFTPTLLSAIVGLLFFAPTHTQAHKGTIQPANNQSLYFIENKGQVTDQYHQARPDIDYKLRAGSSLNMFLGNGKIHYQWAAEQNHPLPQRSEPDDLITSMYRMDVILIGANLNSLPLAEEKQSFYERYYLPYLPEGATAHAYQKITYKDVYPNIDWVFYFNKEGKLEHDFVVHPGGKVSDIKLKYGGASLLQINAAGSLTAITPMGTITESAPYSYQQDSQVIASRFVLEDDVLSFEVDNYTGTLVIDPTLEWATYFGDLAYDIAYSATCDANNNVYITGGTGSAANIATTGAYQTTYSGPSITMGDAYLAKFAPDGNCQWATYYGGEQEDRGMDICTDPASNSIYLGGFTRSTASIATTGAHQESLGGDADAFLVKFDTTGARIWGTYYGGEGTDATITMGIACDDLGKVYITGQTNSSDNISSIGSYQESGGGSDDAFLVKLDSLGQRDWGTYLGGTDNDRARRVRCDASGNVYITGNTSSTTGIASGNAYQQNLDGFSDVFLSKFSSSGSLIWSTYYGGEGGETGNNLHIDNTNAIYITGSTASNANVATTGSHQPALGGGTDAFLARFDIDGELVWATYYGGENADAGQCIAINTDNDLFLTGMTNSNTGIATPGSLIDEGNSSYQVFISKFSQAGTQLWATYYGGIGNEGGNAAIIDNSYNLYIAGQTNSATDIATPEGYQPAFGGGSSDAMLLKLNICEQPPAPLTLSGDTLICEGGNYIYTADSVDGAIAYEWLLPSGWSGSSDSTSITVTPGANSGNITVVALNNCAVSDTISLDVTVNPAPLPVIQQQDNMLSTTETYSTYQWMQDGEDITGATAATYTVTDTGMYAVRVTNAEGCSGTSEAVAAGSTGINDLVALGRAISLYPNPVSNLLYIKSPVPVTIVVSGIEGKQLLVAAQTTTIDLSTLVAGMYLLQVYDSKGRLLKTEKVVKGAK